MSRIHQAFLCAVVMVMMITAGCTLFGNNTGAQPLIPDTTPIAATTALTAPADAGTTVAGAAGTTQPGAAGTQASGTCTADVNNDASNCGGCGYACPANALCQQGQCFCKEGYTVENNACVATPAGGGTTPGTGCPAGMSPCPDGYCYDLAFSTENCGICGNMCSSGMICSASTCTNLPAEVTPETTTAVTTGVTTTVTVTTTTTTTGSSGSGLVWGTGSLSKMCKAPFTFCSSIDSCVNLQTNKTHCGSCATKCTKYQSCVNGVCKTTAVEIGTGLSKIAVKPSLVKEYAVKDVIGPNPGY